MSWASIGTFVGIQQSRSSALRNSCRRTRITANGPNSWGTPHDRRNQTASYTLNLNSTTPPLGFLTVTPQSSPVRKGDSDHSSHPARLGRALLAHDPNDLNPNTQ